MKLNILDFSSRLGSQSFEILANSLPDRGTIYKEQNIKCKFSMKKVEDGFELNGHINALIEIECVRCLEKKSISVVPLININIRNEKKHAFKNNNNEVVYLPNTKKDIDLNPILADIIELSKPMNPICKKQCRGLCEICGINKNVISCYCTDSKDTSIWNKLKKLRS